MKLNKGQRALSQTSQGKEAVAKMLGVTPAEVDKYAAVGMKAMGPQDKDMYAQMGMRAMKDYGMGGKIYDEGGVNGEGGPFSTAQAKIEENLSPLRGGLLSQIESDPKKVAWAKENIPGGLENATVYQLSQAADPNHSETQTNRLTRLARQADLPVATETANLYSRINSGKFDVGVMDNAMLDRGYDGEAGDIFATGVVEGKIPLGAMISADTKDLGTVDDAGKFNFKVFDVPTGAEFLQTNKRRIKNDGSIKGDNTDDLTWYAQLGRGDRRDVSPETEVPETIIPDPPMQSGPGDPMASIPGIGPSQIPMNRPQPSLQGGMRPLKDPTPTGGPGPSGIDLGVRPTIQDNTFNVLGGGRYQEPDPSVIQPGGGTVINPEEKARAIELAKMMQQMEAQRGMGGRAYRGGGKIPKFMLDKIDKTSYRGGGKIPKFMLDKIDKMMSLGGRTYRFGGKY
tara:strand:+ start:4616 stop:5980 length:1365 start_codon:yes stop_codon:yes gene_type:complete